MTVKKALSLSGIACFAAAAALGAEIGFKFEADHPDCRYKLGEEAVVTVTATNGAGEAVKEGFVRIEIDNYGRKYQKVIARHEFATENPFVLKGSLEKPGFLRFVISGKDSAGASVNGRWSVGYELEKIRPATERPADFDKFWDNAVAKFAKEVPVDATMERDEKSSREGGRHDCYRVTFATVPKGRVIRGLLSIPVGEGPWPITVHVPGAGWGTWNFVRQPDRAYLILNVLDYPQFPDKDHPAKELYADQNKRWSEKTAPDATCYYFHGDLTKGREDYFYYGAILGINRAVDWVAELPRIDDKHDFRYEGMSQGGAFGIYLAALNNHFTRAQIAEPAITDVCGVLADGRQSGWPILPEQYEKRTFYGNMMKILPYFDTVHFVPRIKIPTRWFVGYIDILCPPHAVYAAYNMLKTADKKMLDVPGLDHGRPRDLYSDACRRCGASW